VKRRIALVFIALLAWLTLTGCVANRTAAPPRAVDGVFDLRQWDFERDGAVNLEGDWLFYWRALAAEITPERSPSGQRHDTTGLSGGGSVSDLGQRACRCTTCPLIGPMAA